jgi:hypothetical protein
VNPAIAFGLSAFEFIVHYHMDWFKTKYNKYKGWKPENTQFWMLLGADQLVHNLTYVLIVLAVSLQF